MKECSSRRAVKTCRWIFLDFVPLIVMVDALSPSIFGMGLDKGFLNILFIVSYLVL